MHFFGSTCAREFQEWTEEYLCRRISGVDGGEPAQGNFGTGRSVAVQVVVFLFTVI